MNQANLLRSLLRYALADLMWAETFAQRGYLRPAQLSGGRACDTLALIVRTALIPSPSTPTQAARSSEASLTG